MPSVNKLDEVKVVIRMIASDKAVTMLHYQAPLL